jgi:hypothetical protein
VVAVIAEIKWNSKVVYLQKEMKSQKNGIGNEKNEKNDMKFNEIKNKIWKRHKHNPVHEWKE